MLRLHSGASTTIIALIAATLLGACSPKAETPPPPVTAAPAPVVEPPPPPKPVNAKSFTIGALSAVALRDGGMSPPNDNKIFGAGLKPEDVAAVLSAAGQPTDKLELSIQPLLVKTSDRVLLFDTGAGTNFGPAGGGLATALGEAGVDAKSVTDIFISHVHGDHVGGLLDASGALMFPNAAVHISKAEWKYLSGLKDDAAQHIGLPKHAELVAAIKPKVAAFAPGTELIPGVVKAVDIKGHTPGHSGYLITSGTESLLYIGDAMHHFVISVQKPEWTNAFDGDGKVAAASRAALLAKSAESGQRIYAVHFPFPGLGKFEKKGDGFVWVAE